MYTYVLCDDGENKKIIYILKLINNRNLFKIIRT